MKRFTFKGNVWVFSVISKCFVSTQPRFLFTGNSGVCVCVWLVSGFFFGGEGGRYSVWFGTRRLFGPHGAPTIWADFEGQKIRSFELQSTSLTPVYWGYWDVTLGEKGPRSDVTTGGSKQLTCTTGSNISKVQKSCCPCRYLEPKT